MVKLAQRERISFSVILASLNHLLHVSFLVNFLIGLSLLNYLDSKLSILLTVPIFDLVTQSPASKTRLQ